jgi:Zn-dependent peptidase ImmA (M78 family)/plasmid maintenance system antidote protein VapI
MIESKFEPDWFSCPGQTLAAMMASKGLSHLDLADRLAESPEIIAGLLEGTVSINKDLAQNLAENFFGTSSFWLKRQAKYEAQLEYFAVSLPADTANAWLKRFPSKILKGAGIDGSRSAKANRLKELLKFFSVATPDEWGRSYGNLTLNLALRNSSAFPTDLGALSIWLRQGEIEATKFLTAKWQRSEFKKQINEIRILTWKKSPVEFLPRLRQICANVGVALVILPAPVGCRASGAVRFLNDEKAMMLLSFRHLTNDQFWFAFFHEMGHLCLHDSNQIFVDIENDQSSEIEREANNFAANALIPLDRIEELEALTARAGSIIKFARSVGVAPGIVVGQLQRRRIIAHSRLNALKRRFNWDEIALALNQPMK